MTVDKDREIERKLPKQLSQEQYQTTDNYSKAFLAIITAVMCGNFIKNSILAGSLQLLMGLLEAQQIIVLFPLLQISLTATLNIFFGYLMQVASFDLLPVDSFLQE